MKKLFIFLTIFFFLVPCCFAVDTCSKEYLQSHKHAAFINPFAEKAVEYAITRAIKKDTGAKFKVKFTAYTLTSMKKGIFKYLELKGKKIKLEDIPIPYLYIASLTDYNWVDYTQSPVKLRSDMTYKYEMILDQESLEAALASSEYTKEINKFNYLIYPLFKVINVSTEIRDNRLYMTMEYTIPIIRSTSSKKVTMSSGLNVSSGKLKMSNASLDHKIESVSAKKLVNLINYINPLECTLDLINKNDAKMYIENVNIVDNKIKIDGKIFVKGEV